MTQLRRSLVGIASGIGLLAVLVGVPWLLGTISTHMFTAGIPGWDWLIGRLLTPDDGSLLLVILMVVAWLAWLYLASAIVVEIVARVRRLPVPQVRGLNLGQSVAKKLVGGLLLLFAVTPLAATGAHASPAPPTTTMTATQVMPVPVAAMTTVSSGGFVEHTVTSTDTLSGLAKQFLGDADRWPEIFELSKRIVQADGRRLTNPDLIVDGWTLRIPTEGSHTGSPAGFVEHTVTSTDTLSRLAKQFLGDADRWPEIFELSKGVVQADGRRLTNPNVIVDGWTLRIPTQVAAAPADTGVATVPADIPANTGATVAPAPSPDVPAASTSQEPSQTPAVEPVPTVPPTTQTSTAVPTVQQTVQQPSAEDGFPVWARTVGVGVIAAAGVISLVNWRRRLQYRQWKPGLQLPLPAGAAAATETELRAAGDQLGVEVIDRALRALARHCAAAGVPLPIVRAARLTAETFEIYLAEPAQLPEPWAGTADATVWVFEASTAEALNLDQVGDVPAPYPSLVTIGHDEEGGNVFLDLEYVGSLGVVGDPELTGQVLAALAIELAVSRWADDVTVTVVGEFAEAEDALRTGRIRYLPSVDRLLDTLAQRADLDRTEMAHAGVADVASARLAGVAADAWPAEIVLIAGDLTVRQRNLLTNLVQSTPRVAVAAVTGAGAPVGEWAVRFTGPDTAILEPIGLTITPQLLPRDKYADLLTVVAMATTDELIPVDDSADQVASAGFDARRAVEQPQAEQPEPPMSEQPQPVDTAVAEDEAVAVAPEAAVDDDSIANVTETSTVDTDVPEPAVDEDVATLPADDVAIEKRDETAEVALEPSVAVAEPASEPEAEVSQPDDGGESVPFLRVLGPVVLENATGPVEHTRESRLTEYLAFLLFHPAATVAEIDEAIWPDRATESAGTTRSPATNRLRRWLGQDIDGNDYLPLYRYTVSAQVRTDWDVWKQLLPQGADRADTAELEAALALVRDRPFFVKSRKGQQRYAWAEGLKHQMTCEIAEACHELGHRRLLAGDFLGVEQATIVGLSIQPELEQLWRLRILAAYMSGNEQRFREAVDRLVAIDTRLGVDLDPETVDLLESLENSGHTFDDLLEKAAL